VIAWRISNHTTLDGEGGMRAAGRWHTRGRRIVYLAANPATALLEFMVHNELTPALFPVRIIFLKIELPDDTPRERQARDGLVADWHRQPAWTQRIGDDWVARGETPLCFVPSVLVPETDNILLNPAHAQAADARIVEIVRYALDERLA